MSIRKNNKKFSQKETNDGDIKKIPVEFANIDNIPVAVCRPNTDNSNNSLAVWLPYLGGNKVTGTRELQQLAAAGFFAVSLDPWLHGDRKGSTNSSPRTLVFKEFRAYMWQILGITTLDTYRVIDWAISNYGLNNNVVAGGISMGGDIAFALAGIDKRVCKVATIASSPDWNRPGMTDVIDSKKVIEQGNPTDFGKWLYDKINPMTNIKSFYRPLHVHIEFGALDTHINSDWTFEFKKMLSKAYFDAEQNIEIVINDNCKHLSLIQNRSIINRAVNFLTSD